MVKVCGGCFFLGKMVAFIEQMRIMQKMHIEKTREFTDYLKKRLPQDEIEKLEKEVDCEIQSQLEAAPNSHKRKVMTEAVSSRCNSGLGSLN